MLRIYIIAVLSLLAYPIFSINLDSIYNHARSFIETEQWDSAVYYSKVCLNDAIVDENIDFQIRAHFVIAYSLSSKREFGSSLIEYLKAAELAEFSSDSKHKKVLISLYKNISQITHKYHHYDLTRIYINKALKLAHEQLDTFQILDNSRNLLNLLIDDNKPDEATSLIHKTLSFTSAYPDYRSHLFNSLGRIIHNKNEYDSARKIYAKVFDPLNESNLHRAVSQLNYAWTYIDQERFEDAIPELQKTIALCKSTSENDFLFIANRLMANSYEKLKVTASAEEYYLKALSQINLPEVNAQAYKLYKEVSDFYLSQGNEQKAIEYNNLYTAELEKHIKEQENILIQDKKYNMQLLTERYFDNLEKRDLEQKANFQTRLTILISSGIILLVILGFYYRQRRMKLSIVRALTAIERTSKV